MDNPGSRRKTVIIIDNNAANGIYLSSSCKSLMPGSDIYWLLVCDSEPTLPVEVEYSVRQDLKSAAKFVDEKVGESRDIIVFYNPQLGMVQRNVATAVDSQLTHALRSLVEQGRRVLVNVHSTDMPTREVAEYIDPAFKSRPRKASVICHHLITGASQTTIKSAVRDTLLEWEKRFPNADGEE